MTTKTRYPIQEIDWYDDEDGTPPYAILHVQGEYDVKALDNLISELNAKRNGMIWSTVSYCATSASSYPSDREHLVRKTDYERDPRCKMICGISQPSSFPIVRPLLWTPEPYVQVTRTYGHGCCHRCVAIWRRENPQTAEAVTRGVGE